MGKIIKGSLFLLFILVIFQTFPYMLPTIPQALYLPYELWFIILIIFYFILPKNIGTYVYKLQEQVQTVVQKPPPSKRRRGGTMPPRLGVLPGLGALTSIFN